MSTIIILISVGVIFLCRFVAFVKCACILNDIKNVMESISNDIRNSREKMCQLENDFTVAMPHIRDTECKVDEVIEMLKEK